MNIFKTIFKRLFKADFEAKDSEIMSLKQSILDLGSVVRDKEDQIKQLKVVAKSLGDEIDEYNITIRRLNDDISSSEQQLVAARNCYDNEHQSRINLEAQIDRFRQKEVHAQEEAQNHKRELMTFKHELLSAKEKLTELQNGEKSLQNELENNKTTYSNEITTLKSENKNLSDSIAALQHENEQLKTSSNKKNKTIENLEKSLKATIEENLAKISELKAKLAIANQLLNDKLSEIDNLNNTICTFQNEAKDEQSTFTAAALENLQKALDSKTQECDDLYHQLKSAQNADNETIVALKTDIYSKQKEISNLEYSIQQLNESISDLRTANETLKTNLRKKEEECSDLRSSLESLSETLTHALETERLLSEARNEIDSLKAHIKTLPSELELIRRDKEIERLKRRVHDLESKIELDKSAQKDLPNPNEPYNNPGKGVTPKTPAKPRFAYKKLVFPYIHEPIASFYGEILKKKDFPKIENDNIYTSSRRLIDEVYNCRTGNLVLANNVFLKRTAEEISHLRFELDEAVRKNEPYLICPCCHQMVIISSRSVGFGKDIREVQYFRHAVKNIPCDLKRDYTYGVTIDGAETGIIDRPDYLKELKSIIYNALTSEISSAMGISDVEVSNWIYSNELPIMKRRFADISASYKGHNIVFELVAPTTNSSKLHDRDIFYLINKRQVFWILGLNSKADYRELRRSVAKDIMFTNRRNVFVFDIEAQEETRKRGELMLKCNWLDENDDWYYQVEKNGKNGKCISLDQITFDDDSCRPFYHDADEDFYQKHPSAERPQKLSREELKKSIVDRWYYGEAIEKAKKEIDELRSGVEAFYNGNKWGFRYGSLIFIEPRFSEEPIISGDYAKVCEEGNFGVIDRYGDTIIPPSFAFVEILPNNKILYSDKNEWHILGIIDSLASYDTNDTVKVGMVSEDSRIYHLIINKHLFNGQIPEEFYFWGEHIFKKDKSLGKWVLWYSNGVKISGISWDSIEITDGFLLKLINENTITYLSPDGLVKVDTIIKRRDYLVHEPLENGNFIVKSIHGYWGIVDDQDKDIVTPQYNIIETLDKKYLRFQSNGKWGVMNIEGNILIEAKYKSIDSSCDEGFNVSIPDPEKPWESLHGKIDCNGNNIREIASELYNGMYISKSFERFGIESQYGVILKHTYQMLFNWDRFKFIAKKNGNLGIIDINGIVLLPFEYSKISTLKNNRSTVRKGSKIFHINGDCKIIEDEIITLQQGYKKIKKEGKWGIISPNGKELVPFKYDEITTFRGRLIGVINGQLVKLAAYYPYALQMSGLNTKIGNLNFVEVSSVMFQLVPKSLSSTIGESSSVILINWTDSMKYPSVTVSTEDILSKRKSYVDRNEDFIVGEDVEGSVIRIQKKKTQKKTNRKFKYAELVTTAGKKIHIHTSDFINSKVLFAAIKIGTRLKLTKLGYNEDLDRTVWRISISGQTD